MVLLIPLQCLSHPSRISDWIYLGDCENARNNEDIKLLNIKYILNCAKGVKLDNIPDGIKYCHLKLIDDPHQYILLDLYKAFAFIELARESQSNILIHCRYGISRSVSILIAYIIKFYGLSVDNALRFIRTKRKQAEPNYGFMHQLHIYERYLQATY